jgi:hypothetical protein
MNEEVLFYLMLMGFIMVSLILNYRNKEKLKTLEKDMKNVKTDLYAIYLRESEKKEIKKEKVDDPKYRPTSSKQTKKKGRTKKNPKSKKQILKG